MALLSYIRQTFLMPGSAYIRSPIRRDEWKRRGFDIDGKLTIFVQTSFFMANVIRATFYRLEQTGDNTFAKTLSEEKTIQTLDIESVNAVNATGGSDVGGFGWLYSKVVLKQPGTGQELYAMQTVLQLQAAMNA